MSANLDTSDLVALAGDLDQAGPQVRRASSRDLTTIAAQLRDDARAAAPVESGALRDSIKLRGGQDYRVVYTAIRYARFVEFGTSRTAPQPFLWPAAAAAEQALMEALEEAGSDIL